jgi:hypothetical protein
LAEEAFIIDNSAEGSARGLIAVKNKEKSLEIMDRVIWGKMQEIANE